MQIKHRQTIDFSRKKYIEIEIKRGTENSNVLDFYLINNGKEMELSDDEYAQFKARNDSGLIVYATCEKLTSNEIEYVLSETVLATAGLWSCEIEVINANGTVTSAYELYLRMKDYLYDDNKYIPESDLAGFQGLLAQTSKRVDDLITALQEQANMVMVITHETEDDTTYIKYTLQTYDGTTIGVISVPDIDTALNESSQNPVSNEVLSKKFQKYDETLNELEEVELSMNDDGSIHLGGNVVTDETIGSMEGMELTANKTTVVSSSSTDAQYPSAKAVYSQVKNLQTQIDANKITYTTETWTFTLDDGTTVTKEVMLA